MNWRLVAAWVAALIASTLVAWQTVSVADSRVNAQPVEVASPIPTSSTTIQSDSSTTSPTTATTSQTTTSSSAPATSSTSTPSSSSSTTTNQTTSTSGSSAQWSIRTINTAGGVVIVRFRPGEVELQAATPLPGYEVEVDDQGPPDVRVEFDNGDTEIRVEAEWINGELDIDITEHG